MLPLIPIAVSLAAEFAPGLIRSLVGDKAGEVAQQVVGVAQRITGQSDADVAARVIYQDPELAAAFKKEMVTFELELEKLHLEDLKSARARDRDMRLAGQNNTRADLMVAGAATVLLACVGAIVALGTGLPGEAVGIISTIAGLAGSCLKDAFAFEFGSSRGSKEKDRLLSGK